MKTFQRKLTIPTLLCATLFLLTACSPALKVTVSDSDEISYSFTATLAEAVADTARSFSGSNQDTPLFDRQKIQQALVQAGFDGVTVTLPGNTAVQASGSIEASTGKNASGQSDVLALIPGALTIGDISPKNSGNGKELRLSLSGQTLVRVMEIIPAETAEYLELLSAPVLTGEQMTAAEYTELIAAIYGETAAEALAASNVSVSVSVPRSVLSAKVSAAGSSSRISGKTADFSVPLAELLTQSQEIVFCVQF